jgi:beta-glucosidase
VPAASTDTVYGPGISGTMKRPASFDWTKINPRAERNCARLTSEPADLLPPERWDIVSHEMRLLALVLLAALAPAQEPFRNPDAPLADRVRDLVQRMTLEEKVGQMMNEAPAIDRLGVPAYNWWNECLHGVARAGRATVFPQAIGLAATWDQDLMFRVATAISDEARAKHQEFVRRGKRNIYQGLTFWTPNINLFRDPRWGRGMETYGEDPFLTGAMAVQFIKGLQGNDPKYFKVIATAKHYAVHSGPESSRHTFDAVVDERDLRDTYLPQFEMAIRDGGAGSGMCAYNRVDGAPACASTMLLEDILRKQWGFQGYVVSDCGAIGDIYLRHKSEPNAQAGVAAAVKAGTDLSCGNEYTNLTPAVKAGLLSETDIDRAVSRLFEARFRLGMFDPPERVPYAKIPYSVNDSPEHRKLAEEAARKSIVLLKNDRNTLPLRKNLKTVAVIGPDADDAEVLLGNYNGEPSAPVTPLEGIRRKLGASKVLYARGSAVAANLPVLEAIPASALFTTNGADRKPGLTAEYFASANFDGRRHKRGADIPKDLKPALTRVDPQVDFNWWDGAPAPGLPDDDFGVRWTGYLAPPVTGKYTLGAYGMNAFELSLDGKQIAHVNNQHESSHNNAAVDLEAGKRYRIQLDFFEYVNDAKIRLEWSKPEPDPTAAALAAARKADAVVMVLGLSPRIEGEEMPVKIEGFAGGDRTSLDLPAVQETLLRKVMALKKPTVLVMLNGSAVAINYAKENVPAIVEAWYPGQAGGTAIADVLFGDYNPAGRLPVTFYKSVEQLPPFTDYSMKNRTYRYFTGEPLWKFGHGLSYTTFAYSNLNLANRAATVDVANTGKRAGEEVVQMYVDGALAGFQRVALSPGEHKTVTLAIPQRHTGDVTVTVGNTTTKTRLN